ncbi:MAG: carbamoyltransferase HypF, partial [Actinomycetota bacterium]|nr:carbamoyltransferase HypF [Actinomycetota bacterium]
AHLWAAGVPWGDDLAPVAACRRGELAVLAHQLDTGLGCVQTSSMGRLFDAVSALAGVRQVAEYEAEAAIELEGLAHRALSGTRLGDGCGSPAYRFELRAGGTNEPTVADAAPVIRAVVDDVRTGVHTGVIAARFHAAVADLTVLSAVAARAETGLDTVVLGGGVFQNALLLSSARRQLTRAGFTVLAPHRLPPNDGGIALGQMLVASAT